MFDSCKKTFIGLLHLPSSISYKIYRDRKGEGHSVVKSNIKIDLNNNY